MSAALKSVSAKIGKPAPALGVFAMLCALGAAPAHAADVIDSSEVVVTAAGYAQEVKDAPASVTVITRQELENKAVNSLSDALRDVEGVSMLGGDTGTISIRGMESDKVLILVDGRRQNTTGTTQKGGINQGMETRWMPPIEAIERIEVIRGPMSTLYGSEAMGGVINVITRKVGDKWTGAFSTSSTIRQGSGGDALAGDIYLTGPIIPGKLGVQIWGDASARQEDHVLDGVARHKKLNGTTRLWFTPVEGQEFMLGITEQEQTFNTTGGKTLAPDADSKETIYDRTQYDFSYAGNILSGRMEFDAYREEISSEGSQSGRPEVTNTTLEGTYNLPLGDHILLVGGQYKKGELKDSGYYSTITSNGYVKNTTSSMEEFSAFIEDEWWLLDNFSLTGGVRYDHNDYFGGHWSPRAYAVWNFLPDWTLKGGVAWGFKSPSIIQLDPSFGLPQRGGSITRGNPSLDPEKSVNYELGILYDDSRLSGGVTAFYTDYENKIVNTGSNGILGPDGQPIIDQDTGVGLSTYYNVTGAHVYGVEFSLGYKFTEALSAKANYTYTHSKITDGATNLPYEFHKYDGLVGAPLVATPKHMANLTVDWMPIEDVSTFATLQYRGKEYYPNFGQGGDLDENEDTTLTTDIGITWEAYENLKLSAVIYNLFNDKRDTGDTYSYAQDGRRLWLKVAYTF